MTSFEKFYKAMTPFLIALHRIAHEDIRKLSIEKFNGKPNILDVGGRKSHYTIGVPGEVTISDLPRETEVQETLHLGINDGMIELTKKRRTNIVSVVYDDMTKSALPDNSFDMIVAIEVLEHVPEDKKFLDEVYRVLKPGGYFYMTTPNGDARPIPHNSDHVRHYLRQDLQKMMDGIFDEAKVTYAVLLSKPRTWGLKSFSVGKPLRTLRAMYGNTISYKESTRPEVAQMSKNTAHLKALGIKKGKA
jgi:ubiquinone/menaquinone biosynthesis C-methylase UbiE